MNIGRGSYNVVKRRESSELFDVLESGETSATGKIRCLRHLSLAISTPNSCVVFARFFNRERNLRVGLYLFIEIKRQLKILIHLFPKNIAADIVAYLTSNRSEC